MREIKFRGKRIDTGEWAFGSLVMFSPWKGEFQVDEYWIIDFERQQWIVQEETVGQYTGLKDKNSVEIYEGDIIEFGCDGEKETREVRYYGHMGYPAFDMAVPPNAKHYFDGNALSWISECGEYDYYVIGNIHEQEA